MNGLIIARCGLWDPVYSPPPHQIDPSMHPEFNAAGTLEEETVAHEAPIAKRLDMKTLFSSEALEKKKSSPQWHNRNSTAHHEKRIGMAPKGTRRSMGKR